MWSAFGRRRVALGGVVALPLMAVVILGTGCENDGASGGGGHRGGASFAGEDIVRSPAYSASSDNGDSDDNATASGFVGTWALYEGTSAQGTPTWYAHFQSDGTFFISNESDGGGVRVTGTYTVSGSNLVGPFTNKGTGDGRVEATLDGGVLQLDFIEYWHSPHKVIHYAGKKN